MSGSSPDASAPGGQSARPVKQRTTINWKSLVDVGGERAPLFIHLMNQGIAHSLADFAPNSSQRAPKVAAVLEKIKGALSHIDCIDRLKAGDVTARLDQDDKAVLAVKKDYSSGGYLLTVHKIELSEWASNVARNYSERRAAAGRVRSQEKVNQRTIQEQKSKALQLQLESIHARWGNTASSTVQDVQAAAEAEAQDDEEDDEGEEDETAPSKPKYGVSSQRLQPGPAATPTKRRRRDHLASVASQYHGDTGVDPMQAALEEGAEQQRQRDQLAAAASAELSRAIASMSGAVQQLARQPQQQPAGPAPAQTQRYDRALVGSLSLEAVVKLAEQVSHDTAGLLEREQVDGSVLVEMSLAELKGLVGTVKGIRLHNLLKTEYPPCP